MLALAAAALGDCSPATSKLTARTLTWALIDYSTHRVQPQVLAEGLACVAARLEPSEARQAAKDQGGGVIWDSLKNEMVEYVPPPKKGKRR